MRLIFLSLMGLLFVGNAFAEDTSCLDDKLVIDTVVNWNLQAQEPIEFYLPSYGSTSNFVTKAALHIQPFGMSRAQISVDFDTPLMSNPYNIYKVEIIMNDQVYSQDLTFSCRQSVPSIYPGHIFNLPTMIFPKNLHEQELVHIRVWGHL